MIAETTEAYCILSRVPIFADLSEQELAAVAERTVIERVRNGEVLFNEGEPCEGFFIVEKGEVKIFKTAATGREQILTIERAGDSIAELPVFDGGPYPASAMAIADSQLLFISKRDFRSVVLEHPEVALKVLKAVGARLRRLVGLIEELSFTTVRGRLVKELLRLVRTQGEATNRGMEITLPANQELASHIGTVRELVSRNISRLQAEGLLRLDGKRVVIADLDALVECAEEA